MSRPLTTTLALAATLGALGCASTRAPEGSGAPARPSHGVVRSVDRVDTHEGIGAGAVIGGVLGGVAGHQVEGGRRGAATAVGVVGGAVIGHQVDKQLRSDAFRYTLQMDDGQTRVLTFASDQHLKPGQRVRMADGVLQAVP